MSNVAHMPAHKALNIDNFHDAAVKVGMYKNAVTAFMHPYTLGSLETRIRKMGGSTTISTPPGIPASECYYNNVRIIPREFWSKDDVTFCVDQAAGLKDAIARGALKVQDWGKMTDDDIRRAYISDGTPEAEESIRATVHAHVGQTLVKIKAATVNDVTGELELSKAAWEARKAVQEVHQGVAAAAQFDYAGAERHSQEANDAAQRAQRFADSDQVTVNIDGLLAGSAANVGPALQKAINESKAVGKRY